MRVEKREPLRAAQLVGEAAQLLAQVERRVAGALGVILVRDRRAEQRHDPVAGVLVHRALEAVHAVGQDLEEAVEDRGAAPRGRASRRGPSSPSRPRTGPSPACARPRAPSARSGSCRPGVSGCSCRARASGEPSVPPHSPQKRKLGGFARPQLGQVTAGASAAAQLPQKRIPDGFSKPQAGQRTRSLYSLSEAPGRVKDFTATSRLRAQAHVEEERVMFRERACCRLVIFSVGLTACSTTGPPTPEPIPSQPRRPPQTRARERRAATRTAPRPRPRSRHSLRADCRWSPLRALHRRRGARSRAPPEPVSKSTPAPTPDPLSPVRDCLKRNIPKKSSTQVLHFESVDRLGGKRECRGKLLGAQLSDGLRRVKVCITAPADVAGTEFLSIEVAGP